MKHAVYSGTRNLYRDMVTAAKSLVANSSVTDVHFLIEDDKFPYRLPDGPVAWHFKDMSHQTWFPPDGPNMNTQFTYMAMIRCAYADIFPDIDRIVSFDCDTVCVDDVDYLWRVDLEGNWVGCNHEFLGTYKPYGAKYWNAGVTVYDLKKMREEHATEKMVMMLNSEKLWCVEQDCFCQIGKVYTLPERYNESAVTSYTDDPAVIHYASFGTDWHNNRKAPRREYWRKYDDMTWDEVFACRRS